MQIWKSLAAGLCAVCIILYTMNVEVEIVAMAAQKEQEPQLMAQAAVLMDGDTGRVLYGKNEEQIMPMASTTKNMTCILALENASPDDVITVSAYAASMPDVQLNIRSGETYRMEDLLYSLMLESHNDTAVAIAEHVGGSVEKFAEMMNQKARDIGCENTYFITPNGLDAADAGNGRRHTTTARDLAKIMRYCISQSPKHQEFLTITRVHSHAFSDLDRKRSFSCVNHNALLTAMEGAVSGKTGFTNAAGYCYVGAVEKGEKLFVAALLACGWPPHKTYKWQDMRRLIDYGDQSYKMCEIEKESIKLEPVLVEDGIEEYVEITVSHPKERPLIVLKREDEPVTVKKQVVSSLKAPLEAGAAAGQVDYYVGDDMIASYPVVTTEKVGLWDLDFCAKTLLKKFLFCYNAE